MALGPILNIVFLQVRVVRTIHTLVLSPPATGRSSTDRLISFLKQLAQSVASGHVIEIIFLLARLVRKIHTLVLSLTTWYRPFLRQPANLISKTISTKRGFRSYYRVNFLVGGLLEKFTRWFLQTATRVFFDNL